MATSSPFKAGKIFIDGIEQHSIREVEVTLTAGDLPHLTLTVLCVDIEIDKDGTIRAITK
jgi:hypothetical protein